MENDWCMDCEEGLEHCHGTLILHTDGSDICNEPGCLGFIDLHAWVYACSQLPESSCCLPRRSLPLAA